MNKGSRAALGFRAHSGWAAAVAISGSSNSPVVVERRRMQLADRRIPGSVQPYHAAESMPIADAERYIARCTEATQELARQAVRELVDALARQGYAAEHACVLLSSARPLPELARILASHALIHTAEGELYREALREAVRHVGLAVTGVKERDAEAECAARLQMTTADLRSRIGAMGKGIGPPWTQDQKLAAIAAWLVLPAR